MRPIVAALHFVLFGPAALAVKDASVVQQVKILNEQYHPFLPELSFTLEGIRRVPEAVDVYKRCAITKPEWAPRYYQPGTLTIGICDCAFAFGLAQNPTTSAPSPAYMLNTLTIWWRALPGGNHPWYGQGKTILAHEMGHRLGLIHPYESACVGTEANSDQCPDTPRQRAQATGPCTKKAAQEVRCPGQPLPNLKNYMVATADSCQPKHFTPCQTARMRKTLVGYPLPTLPREEL